MRKKVKKFVIFFILAMMGHAEHVYATRAFALCKTPEDCKTETTGFVEIKKFSLNLKVNSSWMEKQIQPYGKINSAGWKNKFSRMEKQIQPYGKINSAGWKNKFSRMEK